MTVNPFEDDQRTLKELIKEWNTRPAKCGPNDMDRLSEVRAIIFGKHLKCPDSILGGKPKKSKEEEDAKKAEKRAKSERLGT